MKRVARRVVLAAARRRGRVAYIGDAAAWGIAVVFATLGRYDFDVARIDAVGLATVVAAGAAALGVAGVLTGLYTGRWHFGSFDEFAAVSFTAAVVTVAALMTAVNSDRHLIPASAPLMGGFVSLTGMAGFRYGARLVLDHLRRPQSAGAQRLLVFGAGEGGTQAVRAMLRDPKSPYVPVALLDDDRQKRNLRISKVPVVGTRDAIAAAAGRFDAHGLLIAIPSAGHELVTEITQIAANAGLKVSVLPSVRELFGGAVGLRDIRPVTEADLLGRHEIKIDVDSIASYITGRRVLVTGAGGSIGSELVRQIREFRPSRLILVDRDESALHAVHVSMNGDSPDLVLADIRDAKRLDDVFAETNPEVVFHAAALKHVPMLETHPDEAFKTNVVGTLNVLRIAHDCGVRRLVNISTDKAADPQNVLGYSKRIGERLTAHFGYLSVRFGNVLGSRGSMLETFRAQIAAGGPITVTHRDVTRYFMTIEEAVRLVVQAGAVGRDGEVMVLDMGSPVRILDVARLLASQADRDIEIVFTGLRPGEKMHETLLGTDETPSTRSHPLLWHVDTVPLDPACVRAGSAGDLRALAHAVAVQQP